jgi:hypothetical protein
MFSRTATRRGALSLSGVCKAMKNSKLASEITLLRLLLLPPSFAETKAGNSATDSYYYAERAVLAHNHFNERTRIKANQVFTSRLIKREICSRQQRKRRSDDFLQLHAARRSRIFGR